MKSKIINEYPNYRIYSDGRIEKLSPMARKGGIYISPALTINGYLRVSLMRNNKSKSFSVHRLVAEHFVDGKTDIKNYVNHIDGNKINNNFYNLEWCDMSYNTKHAYKIGLSKKKGKLNLNDVKIIYKQKISYKKLAKKYGVSETAIKKIKKGKSYLWLTLDLKEGNKNIGDFQKCQG